MADDGGCFFSLLVSFLLVWLVTEARLLVTVGVITTRLLEQPRVSNDPSATFHLKPDSLPLELKLN